jgi:hypothetical protein
MNEPVLMAGMKNVDASEEEAEVDLRALRADERARLKTELKSLEARLAAPLDEIGHV